MAWNLNREDEYYNTTELNKPPKTEHEKKAAKKAIEVVAKELEDSAKEAYAMELREAVADEKALRKLTAKVEKHLKNLDMKKEDLSKLV